jgi:hypothetical protein
MLASMTTFLTRDGLSDLSREFLQANDLTWFEIKHYTPQQQHELQLKFLRWLMRQLDRHQQALP